MTAPILPSQNFDHSFSSTAESDLVHAKEGRTGGDTATASDNIDQNIHQNSDHQNTYHQNTYQWIDNIPGAIAQIVTTTTGEVVCCPYLNAGCFKLLEVPMSVSVQERNSLHQPSIASFVDVIHPEERKQFELALARAAKHRHLWEWEGRVLLPSGKTKWITLAIQPADSDALANFSADASAKLPIDFEATGPTILWNALIQDITARRTAEMETKSLNQLLASRLEARTAELAVSQNRLQKLADNVPDMLYEMRLDAQSEVSFPYVSSACHRLINIAPEQFQQRGVDVLSLVHESERQGLKDAIRASALTLKVCHYECRLTLPSGRQRWVRTVAKPQPQADGSIVWYGCLSDIGDRKQIEAQLNDSLKELADVKFALDCSSNVAITDHRGHITYVNDKFCEISKYSRAELIGQTHRIVNSGYHSQQFFEDMWYTISNGQVWLGEIRNRAKDGKYYWVATTIVPFLDKAGCPYQYVAIRNDITERKRAEMCLVQQADDLEQAFSDLQHTQTQLVQTEKMSSLGQLVAGVAHEINNPVSFIYGNVNPANRYALSLIDLLKLYQKHYPEPPDEIADELDDLDFEFMTEDLLKLLASMKVGAERIRQIVVSLKTFSRKDEAEKKSVDIHQGLESTLMILAHQLKPQPQRGGVEVIKHYAKLPSVMCYAGQLNQVFMNIMSNAIDALDTVESPQLTLSTRLDADQVVISIRDNGMGMNEAVRSQIFNPFFTTKPIGQGTGMGLSISYQIVTERHGGSLQVSSVPYEGTTFTVQIPLNQPTT
ncbi:MAG: PAS domain-containing protein [Cyanobacteria bacterium J06621_11]